MLILAAIALACASFLVQLFRLQAREKIYVGYTTVLSLFFLALLAVTGLAAACVSGERRELVVQLCLVFTLWVLGSVLIYLTGQITLAFEKIRQLSQSLALKEAREREGRRPAP